MLVEYRVKSIISGRNPPLYSSVCCKREFRSRFPSRHFHGKGRDPHFVHAQVAEEFAGPPLKPSMERLQNTDERVGLRAGGEYSEAFCLSPLCTTFQRAFTSSNVLQKATYINRVRSKRLMRKPLKPSMERLQNTDERLGLRGGVLRGVFSFAFLHHFSNSLHLLKYP